MADAGDHAEPGSKLGSSDKLPRAHKRCINKDCREVLSLATKYCKKCNTVQFERKASNKSRSNAGGEEAGGKRVVARKRKATDSSSTSEDEQMEEDDDEDSEAELAGQQGGIHVGAADAAGAARLDVGLANIPQATSYAIQQELESCDREPFDCATGPDKPMLELQAGSRIYYQASIIRESTTEIRVLFPETKNMAERREWVDKRSSRIWRGRMESRFWRYIKRSEGGWEPRMMHESTGAGSFRRKVSGRSRGSRSRNTKHSTEEGTESQQLKAAAAALDTAASPKPKSLRRLQSTWRQRQQEREAYGAEASSSGGSDTKEAVGDSDAERQASGAGVGSSGRHQQQGGQSGGRAQAGDPLEAWFQQHYALLKAADVLGTGFLPASAETGRIWANGAARRRSTQQAGARRSRPAAAAQRSREERRQDREVAQQQAQSSEEESSDEEGGEAGNPRRRSSKGGRELKRLQMWAWERRGRDGSDSSDDDEEASEDESGSKDFAEKGSKGGDADEASQQQQQPREQRATLEQQAQQRPIAEEKPAANKRGTDGKQQRQPAAEPNGPSPSPQGASKAVELRVTPGSGEAKQACSKQEQQQGAGEKAQAKPRAPPKPLAVLEECDVFGKLPPVRRQQSGVPAPTSPRAAAAASAVGGAGAKPGPAAAAGSQLQLPKQPSDVSVKAPPAASPADKQAVTVPSTEQQQQQAANGNAVAASPGPAGAAEGSAVPLGAVLSSKPVLSPLKRKMLDRSGPPVGEVAAGTLTLGEQQHQQQQEAGKERPAKRQQVHAE